MTTAKIFQYVFSISGTIILGYIYYGMFKRDSAKSVSKNEKNRSDS